VVPGEALVYRTDADHAVLLFTSDRSGIAVTPVGRAAWFKDSEGNVLTISQLN
jgi:hypothetical protein